MTAGHRMALRESAGPGHHGPELKPYNEQWVSATGKGRPIIIVLVLSGRNPSQAQPNQTLKSARRRNNKFGGTKFFS